MEKIITNNNILSASVERKILYRKGLGEIVFEKLNSNANATLQIDGITGEEDTYGSFLKRSTLTALKIRSLGITREDIVTICSYNHFNTNIPIIASFFLGVKTASLDPSLSLSDCTHLLRQIKPRIIFVSEDAVDLIEKTIKTCEIDPEIVVFGKSAKYHQFSEFLVDSPEEEKAFVPVEIQDVKETAVILFSSGTSGLAKGICLSHLSFVSQFPLASFTATGNLDRFTTLNYSSPYWISSLYMLLNTIVSNRTRLVLRNFDVDKFWDVVDKFKVSMMVLSPTQFSMVSNSQKPQDMDTSNLKLILSGGSTIYEQHRNKMKKLFPTTLFLIGYGQTEMGGGCLLFDLEREEEIKLMVRKPLSCGIPQPGFTMKVVDLETEKPLGPNQRGELRVKTEFAMNGYYKRDSSDCWDSDGFLKTGDVVYYDEDFCFYVVDRIKDMLKFQGWQITPAKLESILLSHPAVETALVIGLPHPIDGDHPTAIVQLKNNASNVTAADIQKYFDENIDNDRYRLRGGLKIVNDIPVTPTGKYRKNYLKELIIAGAI